MVTAVPAIGNSSQTSIGGNVTSTEIIESLYSAFKNKDYDSFRALCSEDIEWVQNIVFPNGGHHFGAEAVIENVFKQFEKDWEYF